MSLGPVVEKIAAKIINDLTAECLELRQQVADLTAQRDALRDAADIYVRMPTIKTLTDLRALIAQLESETTT